MDAYLKQMESVLSKTVKVGLPADKVGGQVYGDGVTVLQIGAQHEYGTSRMPARSFLRMPFDIKRDPIRKFIESEFKVVFDQKRSATDALERVGLYATNISKEAFRSNGFGQWAPLAETTKRIKEKNAKTTPMIWSGILRNSITWSVD